ncbi:hypothetical protein VTN49DRAFT_2593 [Thermomyces lanuginosus]|uniref:uncharacterized protein n=1 Tax=Thermomyces lanuginosus TaxID=5541 RepID=UPI003743F7D1
MTGDRIPCEVLLNNSRTTGRTIAGPAMRGRLVKRLKVHDARRPQDIRQLKWKDKSKNEKWTTRYPS